MELPLYSDQQLAAAGRAYVAAMSDGDLPAALAAMRAALGLPAPIDPHDDTRQAWRFGYTSDLQLERDAWARERQAWAKVHAQAVAELKACQSFILTRGSAGAHALLHLTGGTPPQPAA